MFEIIFRVYIIKGGNIILNLGKGKSIIVFKLIDVFKKVKNIELPFKIVGRRDCDIGYVVANNTFAKSSLNWKLL